LEWTQVESYRPHSTRKDTGQVSWTSAVVRFFLYCTGKKGEIKTLWTKIARREMKKLYSDISRFVHDGAREFSAKEVQQFLDEEGIEDETTVAYNAANNGKTERINRTINTMARKMLIHANLPVELWGYAVMYAAVLFNAAPRHTVDGWISPDSKYYNLDQDEVVRPLKHSLVFGEYCVGLKAKKLRDGKFGTVSTDSIYLGLDHLQEHHLLLDLQTNQPYKARTFKRLNKFLASSHWKSQGYSNRPTGIDDY
jgi:hypothetical protein